MDLCLKLLNAMIDKYLEVRAPLTDQIEHWQTALLQEKKRFSEWAQLLRESVALQKLENLCEEQIDALQEFRDAFIDNQFDTDASHTQPQRRDLMLVRLNDLIEHANRVQKHASRLESALKAAVDLHFSASANQTNETMRFLAILTAIFAPLTLLTGVYGMNFDAIPGLHNPRGFWFLLIAMVLVTLSLLYYFHRHRIVNRSEKSIAQLLSGEMDV
jgi:Mg2+ and Co2+ transporter CorA